MGYYIKRAGKIFEGDGLINWEFLTAHPQTLHVIGNEENETKLSSTNYYKLKDEMMLNQWEEFKKTQRYNEHKITR